MSSAKNCLSKARQYLSERTYGEIVARSESHQDDGLGPKAAIVKAAEEMLQQVSAELEQRQPQVKRSAARDVTQTAAFKKWFGDSKVVDAEGKPLVVYHWTNKEFSSFRTGDAGAIWFSSDKYYTAPARNGIAGGRTIQVYLSLQNPAMLTFDQIQLLDATEVDDLKARGYDGAMLLDDDQPAHTEIVVFEPEQIKSAIGNDGEFDPESADITRSTARDVTDTPAFKRWFGDSKVVDANGKPLVVYHGTAADFDAFDPSRTGESSDMGFYGPGAYFTNDPKAASRYAKKATWTSAEDRLEGGRVLPVYLSIKKPYVTDQEVLDDAELDRIKAQGYDGIISEFAKAHGYVEYVAFRPEQIKSAIGNDGSFDPKSADITRSRARELGYNPALRRGEVLKMSDAEKRLLDERNEALNESSAQWGVGRMEVRKAVREELRRNAEKAGVQLEDAVLDAGTSVMAMDLTAPGGKYDQETHPFFQAYRDARKKYQALDEQWHAMVAERVGPPEFEGMRQLADFPRPQTETEAFKRWFDGSRVVDADGRPLIAFHGTNRDIKKFRTVLGQKDKQLSNNAWFGQLGTWFAAPSTGGDYEVGNAEATADVFAEMRGDAEAHGDVVDDAVVYPVFLSIKNPYETEGYEDLVEQRDEAGGGKKFREKLEREGYDGVVVRDSSTDGNQYRDDWVAFHSSQIKSAIGNDGSFDPDSDDITRSTARAGVNDLNTTERDGVLKIENLEVDYDRRGEGIGRAAVLELISDAKARGLRRIELDSRHDAEEFWSKMGFRQVGDGDEDSIPMAMDLSPKLSKARDVTQTEEFKRWFGDSKVVDADGKPLVVYHGTASDVRQFDGSRVGGTFKADTNGFFFTSDKSDAGAYATFAAGGNGGENVIPAYLAIKSPITLGDFLSHSTITLEDVALQAEEFEEYLNPEQVFDFNRSEVLGMARERDADGVIFDLNGKTLYIAFRPEQIKSAIGNDGEFDPESADITRSTKRVAPETPEFRRWFGDSKVVDGSGKPLVVFHGTATNFEEFKSSSRGIWFTEDDEEASSYAFWKGVNKNVIPAYLAIQNPYRPTAVELKPWRDAIASDRAYKSRESELVAEAKKRGHDGIDFSAGDGPHYWVVFDPKQIKSAIGNDGNFDPESSDITRSATRRDFLISAAAALAAGNAEADVTLGKAKPLDPAIANARVTPEVEKILVGNGKGTTNIQGYKALRQAMDKIAETGPQELRPLAAEIGKLLPSDTLMLSVEGRDMNAHGVVEFSPIVRMRLFDGPKKISQGLRYSTLLHESLHAAVAARYMTLSTGMVRSNDAKLGMSAPAAAKAMEQFHKVWREFAEVAAPALRGMDTNSGLGLSIEIAMSDPDEFFVRALTQPELQAWMAKQEYKGKTLLQRFIDWVKTSLLGFKREGTAPSWLDAALLASDDLLKSMGGDPTDFKRLRASNSLSDRRGRDDSVKQSTARPTFYSQLELAIENVPDRLATMAAPQWKLWLDANASKLGVKKEEIEWSGIKDYLAMRGKEKVSKDDLVAFVRENGVRVQDVVLGAPRGEYTYAFSDQFQNWELRDPNGDAVNWYDDEESAREAAKERSQWVEDGKEAKFQQYSLPGGERYREVLITLPEPEPDFTVDDFTDEMAAKYGREKIYDTEGFTHTVKDSFPQMLSQEDQDRWSAIQSKAKAKPEKFYHRAHWGDTANVLAHLRVDDRTDVDGKKVLFINELQSDWSQQARTARTERIKEVARERGISEAEAAKQVPSDWGFRGSKGSRTTDWQAVDTVGEFDTREEAEAFMARPDIQEVLERSRSNFGGESDVRMVIKETRQQLAQGASAPLFQVIEEHRFREGEFVREFGLPRAPFVADTASWLSIALKRAIMMAVDGGYDKVAFVTGDQAANFFDLSKQISRVRYQDNNSGGVSWAEMSGAPSHGRITAWDLDGREVLDQFVQNPAKELPDIIGKEVAEKLLNQPGKNERTAGGTYARTKELAGLDLKVGGEGMRAFYDKIVPQVANDILKKIGGGKVDVVRVPTKTGGYSVTLDGVDVAHGFGSKESASASTDALSREFGRDPEEFDVVPPQTDVLEKQPGFDITPKMREQLEDGMPLFSTARAIGDLDVGFGYKVSDWLDSSKKVNWWDKSVGTPYHLAQKHPTFKRVFDAIQNFISDTSKYATRAAKQAPTILPMLEHLSDITKSPISAEDVEALQGPIFQGTLLWTRDANGDPVEAEDVGSAGIVWTNDELRSKWNLNDRQIGLYREARKAINKSVADLAVTSMLRLAGEDAEGVRGRVLAATTVQQAAEILADHLAFLAARDTKRANTLQNTARVVKEQADEARGLMARGYAPLSRFGDYTVYAPGIGEHGYFEMFENERDANRRARALRAEFPDQQVTVGTMSKEGWKLFKGVTPETLALFGDALGLEESTNDRESQVFQEYLKLAKSTRSAMKRLIKRKGVDGFSNDIGRVLAGFVYSNARQAGQNLHAGEILKSANEVPEGDLKDHAIRLVEYAQNPQEEAQAIRGLMFVQYIGGSVASAATNLTQSFTTTFPTLTMHFGARKAGVAMAGAVDVMRKGAGADKDLEGAIQRAEEDGITAPHETHQLMAQSQGKGSLKSGDGTPIGDSLAKISNGWSKAMFAWGKMFGLAESVNRRIAFIAAYKLAREKGSQNPYEFARQIAADTQFTMNKGNNPVWARGPVGATLFTFRKFMVNYLELLARMYGSGPEGKKAFALALAILFATAGMGGLPFMDDLDDVVDGFAQRVLNKSFSSKQVRKEFFAAILGDAGAQFIEKGISGLPGIPLDVSGRLGLGNIVPGTGLLTKKQNYGRDVAEIAGAVGDFTQRVATAAGALAQGEVGAAAEQALPMALANAYKGAEMAALGYYKDAKGRKIIDVNAAEAALKAIGFQPASVDRIQDASRVQQSLIAQNKLRETEIADKWARGRYEKKPELVEEAKRELEEWNRTNPTSPISINKAQIDKRVQQAMMTKAQRLSKTAPKEIRKSVSAELRAAEE